MRTAAETIVRRFSAYAIQSTSLTAQSGKIEAVAVAPSADHKRKDSKCP